MSQLNTLYIMKEITVSEGISNILLTLVIGSPLSVASEKSCAEIDRSALREICIISWLTSPRCRDLGRKLNIYIKIVHCTIRMCV